MDSTPSEPSSAPSSSSRSASERVPRLRKRARGPGLRSRIFPHTEVSDDCALPALAATEPTTDEEVDSGAGWPRALLYAWFLDRKQDER
ncbi:hypothetical protein SS50377_20445 [Spironucleus salmonicida]|uniref:Uncharacterized protein n=1 Tax=Spironucleus salmonicida TaxID=348837 RepID=V6LLM7_9EUKA|nr:hypothetical protein SS50377_20437 [Spironucleus salmonicida]KAH0577095.1 hypothetical protein SS50377_20445 [Spironucleus salmonicida]|eukprot:EST45595.1 Hypothetical protein SS50377_14442 [Spironucleus salmonicida]